MLKFTRKLFSRSVVANKWPIRPSKSTRLLRGTNTRRTGFSWSDSSRRSSSQGSFLARICCATCSMIFDGDTWKGRWVMTRLLPSRSHLARARTLPWPVS